MAHRYFAAALVPRGTTMRFAVSYGACSTLTSSQSSLKVSRDRLQTRAEPIRLVMDTGRQVDFLREAVFAVACPDCQGSGRFDDVDCCNCRGTGAAALEGRERREGRPAAGCRKVSRRRCEKT